MTARLLRRYFATLLFMVAHFLIAACSAPPTGALRVGINPWPGYEFIYLAQEKGFYRDEGLEVKIVEFNSLSDARRAFERGQIDALGTTIVEVLQARDQSTRSPQVVQVVDYSDGADLILAHADIKTGAELRGKRIGVELASVGVYILARGLAKNGLALADVTTISMDQFSMEEAFRNGELDAVVTYPPASIKLLRENKAHSVFSSAEIPAEVVDVIAIDEPFIQQRHSDVEKFLRAFHRAFDYTTKNPTDAHAIMAAREGITPEEFRLALTDGLKILTAADQADYLRPGGKIENIVAVTDRILREISQIKGPDRRANIANVQFVGPTAK